MYSEYEISQMLRQKERDIRALKRQKVAYKTAIEEGQTSFKSDLTTINGKIRDKSNQIQEFCNQTGYK
ncbi:MAG: phage minor capsid protein, partial [Oscillospiraceae bacterium]